MLRIYTFIILMPFVFVLRWVQRLGEEPG